MDVVIRKISLKWETRFIKALSLDAIGGNLGSPNNGNGITLYGSR